MIILDTNVLSALMKSQPEPIILNWINGYDIELLWLSSITVMEIQYGINLLADGKKKEKLQIAFDKMLRQQFRNHIIEFDINCAITTAELASLKKQKGFNLSVQDLQIAGTALARGACIATRNVKDFKDSGIDIINPFVL